MRDSEPDGGQRGWFGDGQVQGLRAGLELALEGVQRGEAVEGFHNGGKGVGQRAEGGRVVGGAPQGSAGEGQELQAFFLGSQSSLADEEFDGGTPACCAAAHDVEGQADDLAAAVDGQPRGDGVDCRVGVDGNEDARLRDREFAHASECEAHFG